MTTPAVHQQLLLLLLKARRRGCGVREAKSLIVFRFGSKFKVKRMCLIWLSRTLLSLRNGMDFGHKAQRETTTTEVKMTRILVL